MHPHPLTRTFSPRTHLGCDGVVVARALQGDAAGAEGRASPQLLVLPGPLHVVPAEIRGTESIVLVHSCGSDTDPLNKHDTQTHARTET